MFLRQVLQNICVTFQTRYTCKLVSKVHVFKGTEKSIRGKEKAVSMLGSSSIDSVFSCLLGTATFFRAIATNSSFDMAIENQEHVAESLILLQIPWRKCSNTQLSARFATYFSSIATNSSFDGVITVKEHVAKEYILLQIAVLDA